MVALRSVEEHARCDTPNPLRTRPHCDHDLGALATIDEPVRYVATWRVQWVAQLSMSAAAFDQLGRSLAVWVPEPDRQQQPLLGPTRLEPAEYRLRCACLGGVYRAANWMELGLTQGNRRTREDYSA